MLNLNIYLKRKIKIVIEKESNCELIIFDKNQNQIIVHTDMDILASKLVYKKEQKIKYEAKKYNAILTSIYGEKVMVFQEILKRSSKELGYEEIRVFNFMVGLCEFENWIHISQSDLSSELSIKPSNISRSIKGLKEKGYIEVIKKSNNNYYRLKPNVGWKGKMEEWVKVINLNKDPKDI